PRPNRITTRYAVDEGALNEVLGLVADPNAEEPVQSMKVPLDELVPGLSIPGSPRVEQLVVGAHRDDGISGMPATAAAALRLARSRGPTVERARASTRSEVGVTLEGHRPKRPRAREETRSD